MHTTAIRLVRGLSALSILLAVLALGCGSPPRVSAPAIDAGVAGDAGDQGDAAIEPDASSPPTRILADRLAALEIAAEDENSGALVVIEGDRVVLEHTWDRSSPQFVAMSASKSVISLAIGLLVDDGELSLDAPLVEHFPEWSGTPKETITLRMMLTMMSGLEGDRFGFDPETFAPGHISNGLAADLIADPGTLWLYSNNGVDLLALLVDRVAPEGAVALMQDRLFAPLEMEGAEWWTDLDGVPFGAGELAIRPRDFARIGQMMLHHGEWNGAQIVSSDWVERSGAQSQDQQPYGLLWWRYAASADMELSVSDALLDHWIRMGAPAEIVDLFRPMVGDWLTADVWRERVRELVTGDQLATLNGVLAPLGHDGGQVHIRIRDGARSVVCAAGWLGQFLCIDYAHDIVAVRMRLPTAEDYESPTEIDGFPDFPEQVLLLTE